jgi:hypothetical protein
MNILSTLERSKNKAKLGDFIDPILYSIHEGECEVKVDLGG